MKTLKIVCKGFAVGAVMLVLPALSSLSIQELAWQRMAHAQESQCLAAKIVTPASGTTVDNVPAALTVSWLPTECRMPSVQIYQFGKLIHEQKDVGSGAQYFLNSPGSTEIKLWAGGASPADTTWVELLADGESCTTAHITDVRQVDNATSGSSTPLMQVAWVPGQCRMEALQVYADGRLTAHVGDALSGHTYPIPAQIFELKLWAGQSVPADALWVSLPLSQPTPDLTHRLTVGVVGPGAVVGPELRCESMCDYDLPAGSTITLAAEGALTGQFTGWSGDCLASSSSCSITLNVDKVVGATFTEPSSPPDFQSPCPSTLLPGTVVRHALTMLTPRPDKIDMLTSVNIGAPFFPEDSDITQVLFCWVDPTGELKASGAVTRPPGAPSVVAGLTTGPTGSKQPAGQWQVIACYGTADGIIVRYDTTNFTVNPGPQVVNIAVEIVPKSSGTHTVTSDEGAVDGQRINCVFEGSSFNRGPCELTFWVGTVLHLQANWPPGGGEWQTKDGPGCTISDPNNGRCTINVLYGTTVKASFD